MKRGRLLLVVCFGFSCGEDSKADDVCTAGITQKCLCTGAADGVQTCDDDGTKWGKCDCGGEITTIDTGPKPDAGPEPDAPDKRTDSEKVCDIIYDECGESLMHQATGQPTPKSECAEVMKVSVNAIARVCILKTPTCINLVPCWRENTAASACEKLYAICGSGLNLGGKLVSKTKCRETWNSAHTKIVELVNCILEVECWQTDQCFDAFNP